MKIAVVGAGGMGRAWTQAINESAIGRVTVVVDPLIGTPDEPSWLTDSLSADKFPSLADVTTDAVDAVVVTAATPAHEEIIQQALSNELHVLVEKPFVTSLDAAQRLVELAESKQKTLMVSQNYRFLKPALYLRDVIQERVYGELRSVNGRFWFNHAGRPYQRAMEHPMALEMAIHHFDWVRALTGSEAVQGWLIEWNSARSPYRSGGALEAIYSMEGNGFTFPFSYSGSFTSTLPPTPWVGLWRFEFDQATLIVDRIGDTYGVYEGTGADLKLLTPMEENVLNGLIPAFSHFVECIEKGVEPWSSGRDNLGTLKMALGFVG